jgi:hypothetical protein
MVPRRDNDNCSSGVRSRPSSSPAQNARPAPASTIARMLGSGSQRSNAAYSSAPT